MNFNLVEMYNGLLRFNKHILNELAEGLKHLPNLDGVSKGDSLIINEQGNPAWGSAAFIPTFENAAYGIEWTKDDNDIIRIGNAKFHRELPIQNRLKGCVYNEKKISYFLNPTGWAKPLENGLVPPLDGRMCAYYGWLKHADAKNLLYKIQSLTGVRYSNWNGKRTNITKYYGKYVRIIQIINYAKYFRINFIRNGKAYYADSRDKTLFYSIHRLNHFPINFKITKYDWRIYAKNRKEKVKLKI